MSRLEKTIQKKHKKRKLRLISKVLFILLMSVNLSIGIFMVDQNAKKMLGEEVYNIQPMVNQVEIFIKEQLVYFNNIKNEIMAQINK